MSALQDYLQKKPLYQPAVVGYLVDGDRVLLGLRKKVFLGLGENLIAGIGGKVEPGETKDQALKREILEEINVKVSSFAEMGSVRFIFPHKPSWQQEVTIYLINQWEGKPQETEPIKPEWFKKTALPTFQMWDDNAYWLPLVLENKRVNGTFLCGPDAKVLDYALVEID
jgi:8-oxo-dGTP diphosphatase